MNEPANFDTNNQNDKKFLQCPDSNYESPLYLPIAASIYSKETKLSDKTLCMVATQGEIDAKTGKKQFKHYDVHNLFGWSQTAPTLQ